MYATQLQNDGVHHSDDGLNGAHHYSHLLHLPCLSFSLQRLLLRLQSPQSHPPATLANSSSVSSMTPTDCSRVGSSLLRAKSSFICCFLSLLAQNDRKIYGNGMHGERNSLLASMCVLPTHEPICVGVSYFSRHHQECPRVQTGANLVISQQGEVTHIVTLRPPHHWLTGSGSTWRSNHSWPAVPRGTRFPQAFPAQGLESHPRDESCSDGER